MQYLPSPFFVLLFFPCAAVTKLSVQVNALNVNIEDFVEGLYVLAMDDYMPVRRLVCESMVLLLSVRLTGLGDGPRARLPVEPVLGGVGRGKSGGRWRDPGMPQSNTPAPLAAWRRSARTRFWTRWTRLSSTCWPARQATTSSWLSRRASSGRPLPRAQLPRACCAQSSARSCLFS